MSFVSYNSDSDECEYIVYNFIFSELVKIVGYGGTFTFQELYTHLLHEYKNIDKVELKQYLQKYIDAFLLKVVSYDSYSFCEYI